MAQQVNLVRVMTEAEVAEWEAGLEEWWASLDSGLKGDLRRLVHTAQRPPRPDLPMTYGEEEPDVKAVTISSQDAWGDISDEQAFDITET